MTAEPDTPRRPGRRRIALALSVLLIAAYPLSSGPAIYAVVRGWIPPQVSRVAYRPLAVAMPTRVAELHEDYLEWWFALAYRHGFEGR